MNGVGGWSRRQRPACAAPPHFVKPAFSRFSHKGEHRFVVEIVGNREKAGFFLLSKWGGWSGTRLAKT